MEIEILYIIIGRVDSIPFYYQCNAIIFYRIIFIDIIYPTVYSLLSNLPSNKIQLKKQLLDPRVIKGGRLKISIDTVS